MLGGRSVRVMDISLPEELPDSVPTFISAKELKMALSAIPDDQPVFLYLGNDESFTIRSYSLHRYEDGKRELVFYADDNCGMVI